MSKLFSKKALLCSVFALGLATLQASAYEPLTTCSEFRQSSTYDATVDSNSLITITGSTMKSVYVASISNLNFSSAAEAEAWFAMRNDNIVSFSVNWSGKEVAINLETTGTQASWGIKEWNDYFKNKSNWY